MKRLLLFMFLFGAHSIVWAGQTCTLIGDGMGGGQMFCNDPDAEFDRTLRLLQQLQQLKAQQQAQREQARQQREREQAASAQQTGQKVSTEVPTEQQMQAFMACVSRENASSEAARMQKIFGFEKGGHAPKELRGKYGSKGDKDAVMKFELRMQQCTALAPWTQSDDAEAVNEIYMLFASGLRTYGETAEAMRTVEEKLVHELAKVPEKP